MAKKHHDFGLSRRLEFLHTSRTFYVNELRLPKIAAGIMGVVSSRMPIAKSGLQPKRRGIGSTAGMIVEADRGF